MTYCRNTLDLFCCLQLWDPVTGKLKKDLTYQAEEMFMMHEEAVLALAFNRESSVLVSGVFVGGGRGHNLVVSQVCRGRDRGGSLLASGV